MLVSAQSFAFPLNSTHSRSLEWHEMQMGRGGNASVRQALQREPMIRRSFKNWP
jgi:hypothetical protein